MANRHINELSSEVIRCAIEVHQTLGPGLLESAYEECLCYELKCAGIRFQRQYPVPLHYKGVRLDCGYVLDLLVEQLIVVELKSVEKLLPIHEAQILTYLRLTKAPLGLLLNFREALLKQGIRRIVHHLVE